ncbi:MAG: GGDEF domain-containing protein [Vitreoscilla sp.]|nr:GGDEF domain-containing protein [Burkholderiales bacterium]MBP6338635.1 GGDEF domain-containing protein [Vitreoscilla sp.]MBP6675744.1 GGDEF domain-containing protein [Vitreoscilla sp.]
MTLDIPTLFITLTLGFLLLVAELTVALRAWARDASLRDWTAGGWVMVLGLAISTARGHLPEVPAIVVGNTALFIGSLMFSQAIYRFIHNAQPWRWLRWGLPLCLLFMVLILPWPMPSRVVVVSVLLALGLSPGVVMILRSARQVEHSLIAVGLMLGLAALALLGRALHALSQPEHYAAFNQPSFWQGLSFLLAFLAMQGAGWGFVLSVFERTARRMQEQATHDGLTGCYNRSTGEIMLAHELQRSRRDNGHLAFVLIDLDHFKAINDQFGHRMGDTVLRVFARTVQDRLRHSDVLCRMGGEEFGLILPGTDEAGALRLTDKIRHAVRAVDLRTDQGQPVKLDFSAGVAVAGEAGEGHFSADRLYGRADNAMYEAKHAGRGRTMVAAGR